MEDLFNEKDELYSKAFSAFEGISASLDGSIYEAALGVVGLLETKDGKLVNNKKNQAILAKINAISKKLINPKAFKSVTSKYLKNFDDVESIQKKIIEKGNKGLNLKEFNLSKEKKSLTDEIINGLLNQDQLDANINSPLKKIIYKHVTTGITYKKAQEELKAFILSDQDKRGLVDRYTHLLTKEPLMRYDGAINQKAVNEFDLDGFSIVGSLIKGSMPVCREMVNGTGRFAGLRINGKYRVEDIDKIISIISQDKGFVSGTNKDNYFINRNHWGCRHYFIPTRLLKRDLEEQVKTTYTYQNSKELAKKEVSRIFEKNEVNITNFLISSEIDIERLNNRFNSLSKLIEEYNVPKSKISLIVKSDKSKFGYVKYGHDKISALNIGDKVGSVESYKNRYKSKVDPENYDLATTFHEFGHFINISDMKNSNDQFWEALKIIKKEHSVKYGKGISNADENYLGEYATTNIDEFLAEGFKSYKLSKNPSSFAIRVGKLVDEYFKKDQK